MKTILMLCLMFGTLNIPPHQDTLIKLKNNGTLIGLPEEYSPANFNRSMLVLEVGENKINFPDCVTRYLKELDKPTFSFSASWYHERPNLPDYEPLPDYISLMAYSKKSKSEVKILISLETLEILKIRIHQENINTKKSENEYYRFDQIEITDSCKKEISNSITKK